MIYKRMIPVAQPKYTDDLTSKPGRVIKPRTFIQQFRTYLENWLKLPAYSATSSEGDNPSTHKHIIPIVQSKYTGDLTSKARTGYQNPKYAQIWVIKIKATWTEFF